MVPKTCRRMLSGQYRFVSVHFNKLKLFCELKSGPADRLAWAAATACGSVPAGSLSGLDNSKAIRRSSSLSFARHGSWLRQRPDSLNTQLLLNKVLPDNPVPSLRLAIRLFSTS